MTQRKGTTVGFTPNGEEVTMETHGGSTPPRAGEAPSATAILEAALTPPLILEGDNACEVASWFTEQIKAALAALRSIPGAVTGGVTFTESDLREVAVRAVTFALVGVGYYKDNDTRTEYAEQVVRDFLSERAK